MSTHQREIYLHVSKLLAQAGDLLMELAVPAEDERPIEPSYPFAIYEAEAKIQGSSIISREDMRSILYRCYRDGIESMQAEDENQRCEAGMADTQEYENERCEAGMADTQEYAMVDHVSVSDRKYTEAQRAYRSARAENLSSSSTGFAESCPAFRETMTTYTRYDEAGHVTSVMETISQFSGD